AQLRKLPPPEVDLLSLLRQRILDLETENIGLRNQLDQLAQLNTQDFVVATDLGASIGKASMPDRSITSLEANLAPAERSLYAVLQDKQRLLAEPFLTALAPARYVLVKIADMFANAGAWRFDYLAQAAAGLATSERHLASLLVQKLGSDVPAAYA